ncbi:late competence development ComFB family protein [Clostridiaceae bacterium 35-E11]
MLKNYMEDVVEKLLPSILKSFPNLCTCQLCIEDIKALTLNHLKPHYVVTERGQLYIKLNEMDTQFSVDVSREIYDAISIVQKNPRHTTISSKK